MSSVANFIYLIGNQYYRGKDSFVLEAQKQFEHELSIDGWAAPGFMKLLNIAVSDCMYQDEYYLEIGTYAGRSLAGALQGNKVNAYVIDNFWDSETLLPSFEKTLTRFNLKDRVAYYNGNAETCQADLPQIGVMLYDANHDRGHTHFNLNKYERFLSDEAIIIVDDLEIEAGLGHKEFPGYVMKSMTPVMDDVIQWLREHPKCDLIMVSPWTFKQAIIHYRRA